MDKGADTLKKLVLITFFSTLYFYIHVNTLYLQSRGLDLLQIASLESIITITVFLSEIPTGIIADRIGRKWSVVLALGCQAAGEFFYIFAQSYPAFVFIAVLAGIGFAFLSGAGEALLYDELPEEGKDSRMKKAIGRIGSAYQLGFFISPLIGGIVVSRFILAHYIVVIAMTACAVTVGFIISLTLHERPEKRKEVTAPQEGWFSRSFRLLQEALRLLGSNRKLRRIVSVTVLTATFGDIAIILYQPLFKENGFSPFLIGAALSAASLLAAVVQRYAYKGEEWFGPRAGIMIAVMLPGVLFVLWGIVGAPWGIFVLFICNYGFREMKKPLLSAYQNKEISSHNRATVLSLINMGLSMYVAVSRVVLGRVAEYSISTALLSGGTVIIIFAILTRPWKIARVFDGGN